MNFNLSGLIGLSAAMLFAAPVGARGVVADPAQLLQIMRKSGYTAELKTVGEDRHIRASYGKESHNFSVYFFGCDEKTTRNCKSVQFFAGFAPKKKPTLDAMNTYARINRWGRIYLDKELDPIIEMDVDMEKGGMSEALYLDNLEYFRAVMDNFADFAFKE